MLREATITDVRNLTMLLRDYHAESRYSDVPFSIAKSDTFFYENIMSNLDVVFVDEVDGNIVGMLVGGVKQLYFSPSFIAKDDFIYVTPEYRGKMSGVKLLKAFINWTKNFNVVETQLGIISGITTNRTTKLYEKYGFKVDGVVLTNKGE